VEPEKTRQERWNDATAGVLLILSLIFILCYSLLILVDDLDEATGVFIFVVMILIWIAFIIDYVARVTLSRNKWRFIGKHIPDLVTTILPVFHPLVQVAYLGRLPYFRRHTGASERIKLIIYAVVFSVLFLYTISIAVYAVERHAPGATITSFWDSVWWACVTMTSTGYGDYTPITVHGRVLGVVLMFGGLVIIGIATATVMSYLSERISPRLATKTAARDAVAEDLSEDQTEA
jgi:voltage-gated potassium channel